MVCPENGTGVLKRLTSYAHQKPGYRYSLPNRPLFFGVGDSNMAGIGLILSAVVLLQAKTTKSIKVYDCCALFHSFNSWGGSVFSLRI